MAKSEGLGIRCRFARARNGTERGRFRPLARERAVGAPICAACDCHERATVRLLTADYGVPSNRLSIVKPGTDRVAAWPRKREGAIALLAVGAVVPRKGYDVLVAALAKLKPGSWSLPAIAGVAWKAFGGFRLTLRSSDLTDRIVLLGAVSSEQLASLYAALDLFVLPSRFEGYGMVYTEAIAHGVPSSVRRPARFQRPCLPTLVYCCRPMMSKRSRRHCSASLRTRQNANASPPPLVLLGCRPGPSKADCFARVLESFGVTARG
jgi:glycosyltransferase involved in cell wall biosynthesis